MAVDAEKADGDLPTLTPEQSEAAPTWRAAYSDRTSALMAAFSELAYLPYREEQTGGEKLMERLDAGKFELKGVFGADKRAFLAVRKDQFAVLAFRGTASSQDWGFNLNAERVPLPGRPNVKVHEGFLKAFKSCGTNIKDAVDTEVPKDLGLYITGHSLGGALAQIASAVLERDTLAACYTFGSPRVGTIGFDREVKCPHYRVVNNWDLVPGVPPPWFRGYYHTGDPRLLTPSKRAQEALRRDRIVITRFIVDVSAFASLLILRKPPVIEDHMIWNYRTHLEAIAAARRTA